MPTRPVELRRCAALFAIAMLFSASRALAAPIYKCVDADGGLTYQGVACPTDATATTIDLPPDPPPGKPPDYGEADRSVRGAPARGSHTSTHGSSAPRRTSESRNISEPKSYECTAANGFVFYRHGPCPKSLPKANEPTASRSRGRGAQKAKPVPVTGRAIPRSEACKRLNTGAAGRDGHELDEQVATYDKNAGRDPCRRY